MYAYLESNIYRFNDYFCFFRTDEYNLLWCTMPIMFVFMGLSLLTNAKDCYDKGAKKDAMIFVGVAIFVYAVTAYNLISRFM